VHGRNFEAQLTGKQVTLTCIFVFLGSKIYERVAGILTNTQLMNDKKAEE